MRRRRFIATGVGVGAGLFAGCSGSNDPGGTSDDEDASTDDSDAIGTFRLLISDQPAAIGDFDSLDVSFSRARIFRAGNGEETDETDSAETATAEPTTIETETAETTETADDEDNEETETDEGDGGFEVRDLDGATVDLTAVVGDKAIGVLDGELEAGRYSKIELYAESVDGIVGGESVDVKIPSGKLQITKSFEVVAGESVDFVFDINVVKKGNGGYNLLPVISESGVAGADVAVEEVDNGGETASDGNERTEAETTEAGGTDSNSTTDSDADSNQTATDE